MIVVDTSALIEIVLGGPLAERCARALRAHQPVYLSAGSFTEALIVAGARGRSAGLAELLDAVAPEIVPVDAAEAQRAAAAYLRWGKGYHPARLNFGDCFAYALARRLACPLLFVGEDFARTDATPCPA